jgi:quinoprotein glucose dehydrogenase
MAKNSFAHAAFLGLAVSVFAADVSGDAGKTGQLKGANRAPVHPPKETPEAAAKNLAKAKIPAGFTAEIWASEPLLANPVAFCFDGAGRMFVSETHRYRTSVLDIRHYMFMLEDDLANRNQDDWTASIKKNFPTDWQELGKESEVVRLVEDSNGDGKADKTSVYADGFNSLLDGIASGVLWHKDALYFTNIPALFKMTGKDTAQKREELHRGYGVRFSYTGHDFHGLAAGPDGRIYFSIGDRGASIKTKEGTVISLPDEGAVFRCEPDGSRLELVMRGLRNPQELAFDDYGNLFTGDNDSDQGDRERWVAIVPGADAGWRIGWQHHPIGKDHNPWLTQKMWEPRDPKKEQPAYVLSPIANLPDGPSGLVHYPGTGLPKEYAGSFFLAGYKGSTAKSNVSTFKAEPEGAGFKLTGLRTFIDNVQATDIDFGPDSRLYVSAWDEGWERSDQGRIYRLSHERARQEQTAQIAEVQKLLGEGFAKREWQDLTLLLGHADQRVRLNAQWALVERMAASRAEGEFQQISEALLNIASKGVAGPRKQLSRLHAIWTISHAKRLHAYLEQKSLAKGPTARLLTVPHNETVIALFNDADAEVRAQQVAAFADHPARFGEDLVELYAGKLNDASPRVRYYAALALAKSGSATAVPAVLAMLRENDGRDVYLQHAGVEALAAFHDSPAVAKAATDESRSARLAVLLACRKAGTGGLASFLTDRDPLLVREAAIAINDAAADRDAAAIGLGGERKGSSPAEHALATLPITNWQDKALVLRMLNANFRIGAAFGAERLAKFAADQGDESLRAVALEMLSKWAAPPARDYVVGIYRPLPKREPTVAAQALTAEAARLLALKSEKLVIAAAEALAATGAKEAAPQLLALVQNGKARTKARIAALDALAALNAPELKAAVAFAATDANPALKTQASKLLGKADPAAGAKQLAASFPSAAVAEKKQILNALADNPSPIAGEAVAALLNNFAKVPPEVQLELLEAAAKRPEAKAALAKYEGTLSPSDPMAKHLPALTGGDKVAGQKLFNEHAVAACMRCHKVGGQGGDAGPALDGIALKKDRRYLLESIVNVNAKIAEGFQMVILTTNKGETLAGLLKRETPAEFVLENPGMPAITVKKADVKQRDNAPSGMLPNIADLITPRELRDIIEYMTTLR